MSKTTVAITLSSKDWEVLDDAVRKVFATLETVKSEFEEVTVKALPVVDGEQNRRVVLTNPTDKVVAKLARLVVPSTVNIKVVNL